MRNNSNKTAAKNLVLKAIFLSLALAVGIIERSIPFDFVIPGVKLGLGNIVVLSALYVFSWKDAAAISLLRCVIIGVFSGMGISFLYSLGGATLSFIAMAVLVRFAESRVSPIGVSIVGAIFHNIGQILVASWVLGTFMIVTYLPMLLVSGVITGLLVGLLVRALLGHTGIKDRINRWR